MKISLVITVLNEESTLDWLLRSLAQQTVTPAEIIIVDGGSSDGTVATIRQWQKIQSFGKKIKFFQKKGNRSVGRNFGIRQARTEWIAITDAGCIPLPDWLARLTAVQQETKARVVAGNAVGLPTTRFEEAVVPYVLIPQPKINPATFLPATRSMLIARKTWRALKGFDETLPFNEDFAFAKKLQEKKIPRAFARSAIVAWLPRRSLPAFAQMIFRFARGDAQAGLWRPKVLVVFLRYLVVLLLMGLLANPAYHQPARDLLSVLVFLYLLWSVWKNKHFVPNGWFYLPLLQVTADLMVMMGTLTGLRTRWLRPTHRSKAPRSKTLNRPSNR